ncbi:hypothetical protein BpHYR1_020480 [Brachionus plicatilis]|uniref:Uncharacterized protein n=1 Tax=Brachionus plicatilis TaxID=10195 RepID=A0A3M7Q2K8_BRAPC|nr:hypothetical protein BpHYR1_020480 [Brachionus plicatilis]
MVLQKVQYCTNLYKRISSSAKTLQFSNQFCTISKKNYKVFTFCTCFIILLQVSNDKISKH